MHPFKHSFVLGLLVGLFSANVLATSPETCNKYRVDAEILIRLSNRRCSQQLVKINFDFATKPQKDLEKAYTFHLRDLDISIEREGSSLIDLNKCASTILPAAGCTLPTLMVFDGDGLLKEIKVNKYEPEACVNIKLYIISLLQINDAEVEKNKKEEPCRDELLYIGKCPVSYNVSKTCDAKEEEYHIVKNLALDQCSGVSQIKEYEDLKASGVLEVDARRENDILVPYSVFFNQTLDYQTGILPGERVRVTSDGTITLREDISCSALPSFKNAHSLTLTSQRLRPVDKSLLDDWKWENYELKEIYKALARDGITTNLGQDIYERTLKCWQIV